MAAYPQAVRVLIDGVDITTYLFGKDSINIVDGQNIFRDLDISAFVKGAGVHYVEITSGGNVYSGQVEARVEIR
jgi:hypothetical protein